MLKYMGRDLDLALGQTNGLRLFSISDDLSFDDGLVCSIE